MLIISRLRGAAPFHGRSMEAGSDAVSAVGTGARAGEGLRQATATHSRDRVIAIHYRSVVPCTRSSALRTRNSARRFCDQATVSRPACSGRSSP